MVFESVKETVYVDAGTLNLRKSPSTDADIITKLERNDKLTRIGVADNWSKVKTASGKTGYVASEYLTKKAPRSSSSGSSGGSSISTSGSSSVSGKAARAVDLAYQALGVRYRYGSESMSGMDCSGLIYWIYAKNLGISVPRTSGSYSGAGRSVSRSDIRPGDVIAMDTRVGDGRRSITHVGIYVGNGNMIHASSRLGRVVIRNVNDYLSDGIRIITIRRFINN
jgi:cell wall-associated NlpC family hydrolase